MSMSEKALNYEQPMKQIRPANKSKMGKIRKSFLVYWPLYVMLLPGTIYLLCFKYLPMLGTIVAFKDVNYVDGIIKSPWVGLKNFKFLFNSNDAFIVTRNTLLYNLVFIFLGLILAVMFAVLLSEVRNVKLSKVYQSIMFFPYFLSYVVIGYMVFAFLGKENGFINSSILPVLNAEKISFYTEPKYWPFVLTGVNLWKNVGYSTVIYLAAILGIDPELYEAATIDGASKWKQISCITIPLIKQVMIILTIMAIGRIFYAQFGLFYNVPLNSGPLFPVTQVIDTYVYRALMNMGDIGMSAAAALYQSCVGFILVLVSNYIVRKVDEDSALF